MGDEQLVEVLLGQGFRSTVSEPNSAGRTPLHLAIVGRETMRDIKGDRSAASRFLGRQPPGPVAEVLLKSSADIEGGRSAVLRFFGRQSPASIVRLLLENGADLEAVDPWGDTALHYPTKCGEEDKARVLLEFGADVAVKADNGESALQMAKTTGYDNLVQLLVQHGARDAD